MLQNEEVKDENAEAENDEDDVSVNSKSSRGLYHVINKKGREIEVKSFREKSKANKYVNSIKSKDIVAIYKGKKLKAAVVETCELV